MRRSSVLGAALTVLVGGCAGVSVKPVERGEHPGGIVFNQPATYLFVYTDNEGGITSELKQLPDPSRLMSARPYAVLSNSNTVLKFSDGMLSEGTDEIDTTKIPKAIVDALGKAAVAAVKGAREGTGGPEEIPGPLVFKLMVADGEISLVGQDTPVSKIQYN